MERYIAERRGPHQHVRAFGPAQELQFELMKLASFNGFDGRQVVRDLRQHPSLWVAALMDRFDATDPLVPLRDLSLGHWNADTFLLLTEVNCQRRAETMAWAWNPTTVDWLETRAAAALLGLPASAPLRVLRVWWD